MASIAAKRVALEVVGSLGKGKKPNITKIAMKNGYTYNTANSGAVQNTATYKAIVDPALDRMIKLRAKVLDEMDSKDLSKERFDTLAQSVARFTHDIQLLSGKSTETVDVNEDKRILVAVIEQLRLPPKLE